MLNKSCLRCTHVDPFLILYSLLYNHLETKNISLLYNGYFY